jgi:hypothetical protein
VSAVGQTRRGEANNFEVPPPAKVKYQDATPLRLLFSKAGSIQILSSGKSGTPPCKSGQLEKELGLEASSLRHAARLIIFEIMI